MTIAAITLPVGETVTGPRVPTPTLVRNAVAIQRGTERPNEVVIVQGHIDGTTTVLEVRQQDAWRVLRHGHTNMDVPISVGVILTLAISFSETILTNSSGFNGVDGLFRFTRPINGAYAWCPGLAGDGRLDLAPLGL